MKEKEITSKNKNALWPVWRWAMVIDLDKCTGCGACVVACKAENNIPVVTKKEALKGREMFWIRLMPVYEGKFPAVKMKYIPVPCMHCDDPPCIRVCPVEATYYSKETGIVGQIFGRCIGCRYCTVACPYTVRVFNWSNPEFPGDFKKSLNPDVFKRPRGVVEKCTFCSHRLHSAKDKARREKRELQEGDYIPACVESCPAKAMYFGDLNNPDSVVSRLARNPRAFRLMEDLGTEPKVIYLREGI